MAESLPKTHRPTDEESLKFAKTLYSCIWSKFNVVLGVNEPAECSDHFHIDIGKAVMCEQMLTRSFYKCYLFVSKRAFILKDSVTALTFCKIFCEKTLNWDYFKRFLRFCALIAEFFLYRTQRMTQLQLKRAPLVWNVVFKKYFADTFYANNGWEGLLQYSRNYAAVYALLEAKMDGMQRAYDIVSVDFSDHIPPNQGVPLTDPAEIDQEMYCVFKYFQSYFASKKKPKTPIEKYHEMVIPEDSEENESTSDSVSSSNSGGSLAELDPPGLKADLMNSLLLEDARKRPCRPPPTNEDDTSGAKSKDPQSELDQPSCSTSLDETPLQDTSLSSEECSMEVQTVIESVSEPPCSSSVEKPPQDSSASGEDPAIEDQAAKRVLELAYTDILPQQDKSPSDKEHTMKIQAFIEILPKESCSTSEDVPQKLGSLPSDDKVSMEVKAVPKNSEKSEHTSAAEPPRKNTSPSDEKHSMEDRVVSENLPQLSSTSEEKPPIQDTSPSNEEGSMEDKDSKKRSQPMDTSDSEDPTKTKLLKMSDSPDSRGQS